MLGEYRRDTMTRLDASSGEPQEKGSVMALPVVDPDICTACGICVDECPSSCYDLEDVAALNRPDDCTECGTCVDVCPNGAIAN